ncbi:MAG: sugar-binding protein [Eubacteriales bacterium]
MKKAFSFLLALMMLCALAVPAFAIGEEMTVKKAVITVDGKIDEAWAQADRQELTYIKNNVAKPDDTSAFVSALWNGNTIYFLFEITDDDPSFASTVGDWRNDGMYLYIEEMGLGGKPFQAGQYQFALIPKEEFSQVPRRGDTNAMGAFEYAYEETDDGFIIECSYTFNMVELAANAEINADFQYNDANEAKERTHNFGWSDMSDAAVNDANVWGTLILSSEEIKTAAVTTPAPAETSAAPAEPAETPVAPATADASLLFAAAMAAAACCGVVLAKKKH